MCIVCECECSLRRGGPSRGLLDGMLMVTLLFALVLAVLASDRPPNQHPFGPAHPAYSAYSDHFHGRHPNRPRYLDRDER